MTNLELITDIMEYGSPMNQIVVIEGVARYCEQVIEAGAEAVDSPLINGEAFVASCEDILKRIQERP